jgi:hypothetical protein
MSPRLNQVGAGRSYRVPTTTGVRMDKMVWQLDGTIEQWLYSPKGNHEGLLLDVGGVRAQFVWAPDIDLDLSTLQLGQPAMVWGTVRPPSPKGEAEHEVYDLVDIRQGGATRKVPATVTGRIVGFNYAKHGEKNGVLLDTGDFIHTKPEGLRATGWKLGQKVSVKREGRRLEDGSGLVIEHAQ